jgi:hypothetical protein
MRVGWHKVQVVRGHASKTGEKVGKEWLCWFEAEFLPSFIRAIAQSDTESATGQDSSSGSRGHVQSTCTGRQARTFERLGHEWWLNNIVMGQAPGYRSRL